MTQFSIYRSCVFACVLAAASVFHAQTASAVTTSVLKGSLTVKLQQVATINSNDGTPQDLVTAPDALGRIFIATRNGDIRIMNADHSINATPFLNMAADGLSIYTGGEGGFLGLAFAPDFATSGKFYTTTTEPFSTTGRVADYSEPELFPTTSTSPNNQILVREWTAPIGGNVANATSRVLLTINHPQDNHQGGSLRFGPDGNLYIGLGDGGGGNDENGPATSTTDGHTNATGNAQDLTVPLGKILRINPNPTGTSIHSANGQYSIPTDNPFATATNGTLKEIYAYGMRNPYKFSFDASTLYLGDVGQSNREEVDTVVNGGNYGWPFREGTRDNSGDTGRTTPAGFTSLPPISEYTHADGEAIIGGVVYHGSKIPALDGKYVFADLGGAGTNNSISRLYYTDAAGGTVSEFNYDLTGYTPNANIYGYGIGPDNELYGFFSNGAIVEFVSGVPEPSALAIIALTSPLLLRKRSP